jgi:hypothetical protein
MLADIEAWKTLKSLVAAVDVTAMDTDPKVVMRFQDPSMNISELKDMNICIK